MAGPKVSVIGAGSYFFGRQVIWKMATSPVLQGGTLALVDTDPKVLKTMMSVARRVFKAAKFKGKLVGNTDYKKVVPKSDFIVLTFSHRNAHYRGVDTELAMKHGIRMCSSDTIGPGGIFRALREVPKAVAVAKHAAKVAPDAWVINFINPTTVLGMALRRYVPEMRSFALCDGNHEPYATLRRCKMVGILPEDATEVPPDVLAKLDLAVGGVNHCTWLVRFSYDGKDYMPKVRRWIAARAREEKRNPSVKAKPRNNSSYAVQLFDLYGAYPTAVSHTKEYVPFFQGYGVAPVEPEPIRCFDAKIRASEMARAWGVTAEYASGKRSAKHFLENVGADHATDIIESMWGGLGKPFYINTTNGGAVTNMPDEAFLELRSDVDMRSVRRQPFGELPRGVLGLTHQVLDTHELTAEAAMTGDRSVLRRAMLTDPICNNIRDADNCIRDLLKAEREALPSFWFRKRGK